ncbi:uracil-DNA glycosylase [Caballeronia humi]|uniref:Type-4 uracil-DNA glycosylase n=1 Tax=Caballeronia humi TaxID=326474 RepID=A0A158IAE6_9BURK|nr:uracil-DNA glycosylase [Caballeronia humi]SAL53535.1 phage SPO1 DNA polymerase--like protein [Caballeronia humi]
MALHESMLEEFGLGPVWVRRRSGVGAIGQPAPRTDEAVLAPALPPRNADVSRAPVPLSQTVETLQTAAPLMQKVETPRAVQSPTQNVEPLDASASFAQDIEAPRMPASFPRTGEPPQSPADYFDAPPFDDLPWLDDDPVAPLTPAAIEPPADTHTLDWPTLADRVANCQLCRLCERRTNTVFGVGDREADWMLIGEAPGENEDKLGEPFVGQAGKLLDSMLRAVTLARDSNVYIANVIKCRPPGNRNPEPDEVARCEPYLQRQVALVKPKVIVALGRFAAQSLLKTEASIASLRGRVHQYEGVPVIVTYHPAYLLRSLPDKAKAWADLCLANKTYREALDALGVAQGGN